jgi:outer membrane autotransporter protein
VHGNDYSSTITGNITNAGTLIVGTEGHPSSLLVNGNYTGNGGTVNLNVALNSYNDPADATYGDNNDSTGDSPGDVLIITPGHNVTGSSVLNIHNVGGLGAKTTGNGIEVVEAQGTTGNGIFTLGNHRVAAGAYEYNLFQGNAAGVNDPDSANDWYLRSRVRSEIPLYKSVPTVLNGYTHTLIDTMHERVGDQYAHDEASLGGVALSSANTASNSQNSENGAWLRVIGTNGKFGNNSISDPRFFQTNQILQVGFDLYRRTGEDRSRDYAGLYTSAGTSSGHTWDPLTGNSAGTFSTSSYSLGGYWSHFGASGWYVDGLTQVSINDIHTNAGSGEKSGSNAWGFAASLESGIPFRTSDLLVLEPQMQLVYQAAGYDNMRDSVSTQILNADHSFSGRVGIRIAKSWALNEANEAPRNLTLWARPSVWHEFSSNPKVDVTSDGSSTSFQSDERVSWLDSRIGIDTPIFNQGSFFASTGYQVGIADRRDSYDVKLGLRFTW